MKHTRKYIGWVLAGVALGLVLSTAVIAYKTNFGDAISLAIKKFYPAALVGGKFVSVEDAQEFINVARKMDPSVSAATAYQTYLNRQKNEVVLSRLGVRIPSDAVSDELNFYQQGDQAAFQQILGAYFDNDQKTFRDNVVYPEVVEAQLEIYYNTQRPLNSAAWDKALGILKQIGSGQKFEDLAKSNSDDKQTAQVGGDMGFFSHGQILPELENQIVIAKIGVVDQNIVVTRDGLEIIYLIEESSQNNVKSWHAKHILIQTSGFDDWLASQTANIPVKIIKRY